MKIETKENFNGLPFTQTNDENHYLIDFHAIILPFIDVCLHGALNCEAGQDFPYIRDMVSFDIDEIYYEHAMYSLKDLLRKFRGLDENEEWDLDKDYYDYFNIFRESFDYSFFHETVMSHSVFESAMYGNVKSITIVNEYGFIDREVDFLLKLFPKKISDKIVLFNGNIYEAFKDNPKYSLCVSNSYDTVKELIVNRTKYKITECIFLLCNSTDNVKVERDGLIKGFYEIGNDEILKEIVNLRNDMPSEPIRFGRFEPLLYKDMNQPVNEHL